MQIGFFGVLTLVFVATKIFGFITWSWWLVFSPLLFGTVIVIGLVALAATLGLRVKQKWQ